MKVNSGNDFQARVMGGDRVGEANTATSTTATSLTRTGASWTTDAWVGHIVVAGTVYGVVLSNTATVLTIDRWYNPATPGGAAGSTPSGTTAYMITPGGAPGWYMALTANSGAPAAGDTTLTGEITTAGGGLIRQLAAYAHTTGAASYTLTGTYTANGSDSLPVTVAKMATFNSLVSGTMVHETLLSSTATLSAVSDQLTVTQTVST
jgi:hypothetical protein